MSETVSIRTVSCKLALVAAARDALVATARAFNAAATYCAQVAWDKGVTNKNKLHKLVYGPTRVNFGLGAQLACCARDKAAEAVRAIRSREAELSRIDAQKAKRAKKTGKPFTPHTPLPCPTFAPASSIRYDARTYRLLSLDRVSLNTITGRVIGQLVLGEFQRLYLYDLTWTIGGAELVQRDGVFFLNITQTRDAPALAQAANYLGVDLGIVHLATDSDGAVYSGADVQRVRKKRHAHRRRLQLANTRRSRWRLRQTGQRERRFQKDVNHRISKALVSSAKTACKAIALEDLQNIRERTTVRHTQRRRHSSWAFRQLREQIAHKAQAAGVMVVLVDPRDTSRTCAMCGYCEKRNRPDQAHFHCRNPRCGHSAMADANAAQNIARVAAVNQPIVSLLGQGIERADTSCLL